MKEDRGCTRDSIIPGRWEIDGVTYSRCPISIMDKNYYWYVRAHNFMNHGMLPYNLGWMQHPNKFIEAMSFISKELSKNG